MIRSYSVFIDSLTNKMEVSALSPWRFYNSADKSTYPNNTHKVMGFDTDVLESFFIGNRKDSYDMVNLNEIDAVHISIGDQVEIETLDNQGTSLVLPVTGNQLDFINYSPEQGFQQYISFPKHKNNLKVSLRDGENNILDMNNLNWYLIFERCIDVE